MVMIRLNVHDAKTHLSRYLERLEKGEEDVVIVCRRNVPIAELRALPKQKKRSRAIFKTDPRFRLAPEFFEPLPDDVVAAFDGEA